MKLFLLLVSFLSLSSTNSINKISDFSLLGTWTNNSTFPVEYNFKDDGTVYFTQSGFGSIMKFHVDESKNPIWIDFETTRGKTTIVVPGLMKIIHQDTIIIEQFGPTSNHPTSLSEDGEQMNKIQKLYRDK